MALIKQHTDSVQFIKSLNNILHRIRAKNYEYTASQTIVQKQYSFSASEFLASDNNETTWCWNKTRHTVQ